MLTELIGKDFVIVEWTDEGGGFAPPRFIAPLHLHREDDEAWYVLEGALCVQRGDEVVELASGEAVLVPKGTPHTYWNPSPDPCRYLLVMTPRVRDLIANIHTMEDRTWPKLQALFEIYDAELC